MMLLSNHYQQGKKMKVYRIAINMIKQTKILKFIIPIVVFILLYAVSTIRNNNVRKDGIQSESINPYIPVAAQITMDKLSGVLKNVQAGRTEYDFTGRYPNDSHSLRMPKYPKNLSLLSDSQKELLPVSHLSPCIR